MTTVGNAVKITNFKVPSSYLIEDEENPGSLILDCEYKYQSSETGIVVTWDLDGERIYQWIAGRDKNNQIRSPTITVSIFKKEKKM